MKSKPQGPALMVYYAPAMIQKVGAEQGLGSLDGLGSCISIGSRHLHLSVVKSGEHSHNTNRRFEGDDTLSNLP